ncbi:hypothetical protein [Heyndrickxia vini]|uniref:Uncharacterized protein n=1 Tax=Heyndrickxia vini TaxID=1476025 RepID=A0ABX7E155_9BACI|nr:hypothetical protein [Heyndrickxia vini]QQZ09075.1 hypothetical protein I5776_19160 [Heyndrickxia vini]
MKLRVIKQTDAIAFAQICKDIDGSGFMLYELGERVINLEKEEKTS